MSIAKTVATASKDPSSKVGSVIISEDNRIISTGYNGFIAGSNEHYTTFERPMKYHLTIHAEMNALLHSKQDLKNKILYTTLSPCDNCLKHILQTGIRTVYYDELYIRFTSEQRDALRLLIKSTNAYIVNINSFVEYIEDLEQSHLDLLKT
jgi:dCMP deaminase